MIASLNIMAKTFVKIAKTFVGLSKMIVEIKRRLVLILHLEAKYVKIDCKNGIYGKNWVRSPRTAKSQTCEKPTVNTGQPKSMINWRLYVNTEVGVLT